MHRVRFLIWKELIELTRDPRLLGIVIVAPLLQLFLLAYAASTDIRDVPIVIADADRSAGSRDIVSRFAASPSFTIAGIVSSPADVDAYLSEGRASLAISIPPGYGEGLRGGRPQTIQIVADGSDANSAGVSLGYATNLIAQYGGQLAARSQLTAPRGALLDPQIRVWFNPRLESRDFMIPGVVALLLLLVTTNLSSMGIVREKEVGTLEQLNVAPIQRWELMVGKLLPYALIGLIEVVLVLSVAVFWFEVPMRGSVPLLFAMCGVYLLTTLGLGLFISTISATQQQAMMTTTFFFLIPMVYLSGFIFPIENMPVVIQWITYVIPLRYFLVIVRAIFLKGVGLETFWPEALALAAWGVAILLLAIVRSSKRMA
jgi:ABC-2 type transport system permease protein